MKWKVEYRYSTHSYASDIVEADTYTMALLEVVIKFRGCEYFSLTKVEDTNELLTTRR